MTNEDRRLARRDTDEVKKFVGSRCESSGIQGIQCTWKIMHITNSIGVKKEQYSHSAQDTRD